MSAAKKKKKSETVLNDDDDSENDSDFELNSKDEADIVDGNEESKQIGSSMSTSRKRKAEGFWQEMQQEEQNYLKKIKLKTLKVKNSDLNVDDAGSKRLAILSSIFGQAEASRLCNIQYKDGIKVQTNYAEIDNSTLKKDALEMVKKVKRKVKVVEKRKFAGQEIRYYPSCIHITDLVLYLLAWNIIALRKHSEFP